MRPKITDRIDAITHIPPEYQGDILPAPKSVKIELTARCDFKCFFCASAQRLRSKDDMPLNKYREYISQMRDAGVQELGVFYLGESFILRNLDEYIAYAKDIGFPYVFLTTNGLKANSRRIEQVMDAGLDSLKFSFNWSDSMQFNEVTGMPGNLHAKVVENIKVARIVRDRRGFNCNLYASSIMYDGEQQGRMEKAVQEILPYVDEHYWLPLYNQGALVDETIQGHGFKPIAGNQGRVGALREPLPCWSAFTEGHVTYDGKLSACCFDHSSDWEMGDLNTEDFMTAWNSEKFQQLRRKHLAKDVGGTPCQNCVAYQ